MQITDDMVAAAIKQLGFSPADTTRIRAALTAALAAQADYEARIRSAIVETAQPVAVPDGWLDDGPLTPEEAWTILCETPDITSPEEYPDHALITMEQLAGFMQRAAPQPPAVDDGWRTMDSAPKDKTPVIIAVPTKDRDGYIVGEAYFDAFEWWWAGSGPAVWGTAPISDCNHHEPFRWRPLPPAPANGGEHG